MSRITRRDFLKTSSAAAAGISLPAAGIKEIAYNNQDQAPKIKRFKPLGKTGWQVGDLSTGAGQREPGLIEHQFKSGINYIDTAHGYGPHEETIGKILRKYRDKVFVTTKWPVDITGMENVTKEKLLESLDEQLKRLDTTYVDCMMIHGIGHPILGDITRIQNPVIYEAWDEAKRLGKVRFTGTSSCGPNMIPEVEWGIDNNRFDVVMFGANFMTRGLEPLLKKARAKGVATVAMKTMTIFKTDLNTEITALMDKSTNARQAVLKYVLAQDLFDTIVCSMPNYDRTSEYLSLSGHTAMTEEDEEMLGLLSENFSHLYCRPGCDGCLGACPKDVQISSILRYKMYFENYGEEKMAMERYASLPREKTAAACGDCKTPCDSSCRYGIKTRERLIEAHQQLTFA